MKKAVILLAGLLTVLSMGFASAQFSDVPAGHWAKEAVEKIAAEGIILGFPDGTFRGNENLTRYQAAMIIYRLLQKLEPGQMGAMDQETITALRNAVQELAAELASLGVRVSALEDNAASKSDVARLEKMIAELKGMPSGEGASGAALKDLADRVEAAAIAADTALAQVQALEGKVDAVGAQASANADSIKALNELAVLLNQDVLSLQDRVTALEKASGMTDLSGVATKDDVQSVRDYVTAIRGDLVNVSNKVSALEANVGDLQDQVDSLKFYQFTVSGSISGEYSVYRVLDGGLDDFDTDRLFATSFSTGEATTDKGDVAAKEDLGAGFQQEGTWSSSLTLKLLFPNAYEVDAAGLTIKGIEINGTWDVSAGSYTGTTGGFWDVTGVRTSFTVGNDPLMITLARQPKAHFTEYVFDNDYYSRGTGYVVEYKGILDITGVYGSTGDADTVNADNRYYRGVMAGKSFENFSIAAYAVQEAADVYGPAYSNTVYGGHATASFGPLSLEGEYDMSNDGTAASVMYFKGGLNLGDGKFKANANYRAIDPNFAGVSQDVDNAGYQSQDSNGNTINGAPFGDDQKGYGFDAAAELGAFSVSGYYDHQTDFAGTATSQIDKYGAAAEAGLGVITLKGNYDYYNADATDPTNDEVTYGGSAAIGPMKGFTLEAFYSSATLGGAAVDGPLPTTEGESAYGASLTHDGANENALISGLNLTAKYKAYTVSGNTDIQVYGDFDGKFGVVGIHPMFRYHMPNPGDTTIKYGAQVKVGELGVIFKPTLMGDFVSRTTGTTSEMKYGVGLELGDFIFGSSLKGGYASYTATNVNSVLIADTQLLDPFNPADDRVWSTAGGGVNGSLTGYFFEWTYEGMQFAYIDAIVDNGGSTTHGQAFKVSYSVEF